MAQDPQTSDCTVRQFTTDGLCSDPDCDEPSDNHVIVACWNARELMSFSFCTEHGQKAVKDMESIELLRTH